MVVISGEGQVYTVGMIGAHRVVSTKLSRVGHGGGARVAAGNVVTRLLGETHSAQPSHKFNIK